MKREFKFSGMAGWFQVVAVCVSAWLTCSPAKGQMFRPDPTPGGIDPTVKITALRHTNNTTWLTWHGPPGWCNIETTPVLNPIVWSSLLQTNIFSYWSTLTFSNQTLDQSYFRLRMPPNGYVGSGGCSGCHDNRHSTWRNTAHFTAYQRVTNTPLPARIECLPCHSVGGGRTGGFVDMATTPHLADVGCETCHGPGAAHKYGDHDVFHPVTTVASEVCGGCHSQPNHPAFQEWTNSAHVDVTAGVRADFLNPDPLVGQQRQMGCGACHSAATRVAMLNDVRTRRSVTNTVGGVTNITAGRTNYLKLPLAVDAAEFGQTCAVCHDPHERTRPAQLRGPIFSTHFFTLPTTYVQTNIVTTNFLGAVSTNIQFLNNAFATNHDPRVQLCGQCHNTRGADWTSSGRPPHHSPQYNLLIGAVQAGYINGTNNQQVIGTRFGLPLTAIGPHGQNTNGCAQCHMHATTVETPTPSSPNYTGHSFDMRLGGCALAGCHNSTFQANGFLIGMQAETTNNIAVLLGLLNRWATNKAPLITNAFIPYGKYAWEYTSAGQLSNPTGTNTIAGPPSALQARIPNTIKQARFNLYLVEHDGSTGVHNPDYVRLLFNHAISNVNYQLSQP